VLLRRSCIAGVLTLLAAACTDVGPSAYPRGEEMTAPPHVAPVVVPEVGGMTLAAAKKTLRAARLTPTVRFREFMAQEPHHVIHQFPAAGFESKPHHGVRLVVAKLPPRVPNVVGEDMFTAELDVGAAGFKLRVSGGSKSYFVDVVSQHPAPGTRRFSGSIVTVVQSPCTSGYSPCLPPATDYDCAGGTGDGPKYSGTERVTGYDPYGLDSDGDGWGCE
jgi:hypothetical protein